MIKREKYLSQLIKAKNNGFPKVITGIRRCGKSFLLKELWFFDKQRSVMEVRIIGISPIRIYYREEDTDQEKPLQKKTFWIYYPEARKILSNAECMKIPSSISFLVEKLNPNLSSNLYLNGHSL